MSEELVKLPINGMQDIADAGALVYQSGMLGVTSPAAGFMVMATCHQEGMSLLEFKRRYHVDNRGNISMRSDRMLAEFMERGGTCKWITKLNDAKRQAALFTYGVNENIEVEFTIEEAKKAGYIKSGSNWEKDPASQMRARVITRGVRAVCPGAVAGVYCPEEMQDVYATEPKTTASYSEQAVSHTVTVEAEPEQDYSVCPVKGCEFTGKPWDELDTPTLEQAITLENMGISQGHIDSINKILEERKNEQG